MLNTEILQADLESEFFRFLESYPLDDVLDALEGAFYRRAGDVSPMESDPFRNISQELRDLRNRDFALCSDPEEIELPLIGDEESTEDTIN